MKLRLFADDGRRVELGAQIGRGGEGAVFEVAGQAALVAKVYHRQPSAEQEAKLLAMARLRTARLLELTAWPVATLHLRAAGPVRGLLMPRVDGKAIHLLYSPKSRLRDFPAASWAFLVVAAANLARAIAVVHEHGHVVADVNHGNALVAPRATMRLIDCDSFQVRDGERVFLCAVGVGPYVPPELQGRSLHVLRTPNHDAFGLAVLLFQLLFLGRHPFSGRFLGAGDMPLETAIRELRFAYGAAAARHQMRPPPATPPLAFASPPVAALFERAFSAAGVRDGGRPAAAEWIEPLARLGQELRGCARNPAHEYWRALPDCPWCPLETAAHTLFFDLFRLRPWLTATVSDPAALWGVIAAVRPPAPYAPIVVPVFRPRPSVRIQLRKAAILGPLLSAFLAIKWSQDGSLMRLSSGGGSGALVVAMIFLVSLAVLYVTRLQVVQRVGAARQRLQGFVARWPAEASARVFADRLRELDRHHKELVGLPEIRRRRLTEAATRAPASQEGRFLRGFSIDDARRPGLDDGWRATLRSYGVETAEDVVRSVLAQVPGLPKQLRAELFDWRRAVEQRFHYDSAVATPAEEAEVERELARLRHHLEEDLRRGGDDLRRLKYRIEEDRQWLHARIVEAASELGQAEVDQRYWMRKR